MEKLPLSFEVNLGQTDAHVKFLSRGRGYSLFLTGDEAVLTLRNAGQNPKGKGQKAKVTPRNLQGPNNPAAGPNTVRPHRFAGFPNVLSSFGPTDELHGELEGPWDRRAGVAPPSSSPSVAESGNDSTILRMRLVGGNPRRAVSGSTNSRARATTSSATTPRSGAPTCRATPR